MNLPALTSSSRTSLFLLSFSASRLLFSRILWANASASLCPAMVKLVPQEARCPASPTCPADTTAYSFLSFQQRRMNDQCGFQVFVAVPRTHMFPLCFATTRKNMADLKSDMVDARVEPVWRRKQAWSNRLCCLAINSGRQLSARSDSKGAQISRKSHSIRFQGIAESCRLQHVCILLL